MSLSDAMWKKMYYNCKHEKVGRLSGKVFPARRQPLRQGGQPEDDWEPPEQGVELNELKQKKKKTLFALYS